MFFVFGVEKVIVAENEFADGTIFRRGFFRAVCGNARGKISDGIFIFVGIAAAVYHVVFKNHFFYAERAVLSAEIFRAQGRAARFEEGVSRNERFAAAEA